MPSNVALGGAALAAITWRAAQQRAMLQGSICASFFCVTLCQACQSDRNAIEAPATPTPQTCTSLRNRDTKTLPGKRNLPWPKLQAAGILTLAMHGNSIKFVGALLAHGGTCAVPYHMGTRNDPWVASNGILPSILERRPTAEPFCME